MKMIPWIVIGAALCLLADTGRAQTTVMSDSFNNSTTTNRATGWKAVVDGATVTTPGNGVVTNSYIITGLSNDTTVPHVSWYPDYGGIVVKCGASGSPTGGLRGYISPAYPVPSGTTRVVVKASLRGVDVAAEDVALAIKEEDASGNQTWIAGGVDFANPTDLSDFIRLIPTFNWRTYTKTGELKSTTVKIYVELVIRNNANTTGTIYMDDVSVNTSTNTSYLVEAYSGIQGNVFAGTTNTVNIYPYDSRAVTGAAITVVDENGAAISPAPTVTAGSGFSTVALPAKGYYSINATGSTSGGAFTNAFPAAVIDPSVPAVDSTFGMFSVDTCNPQALLAGSAWNRFFIYTGLIRQHPDGSFYSGSNLSAEGSPAPPDMVLLPTNQQWHACLVGMPEYMAKVPAGETYDVSKIYPPLDWPTFKSMVQYVVSQLPPSVEYFEVINEPEYNFTDDAADWTADLQMYFKTVHDAIADMRTAGTLPNPDLKIVGPSFAHFYSPLYNGGQVSVMNNLFAGTNGILNDVDEISMHGYTWGSGVGTGTAAPESQFYDSVYQWVKYMRGTAQPPGLLADDSGDYANGALKPIHMTEYGWAVGTGTGELTPAQQEAYVARSMILQKNLGYDGEEGSIPFAAALSFSLRYVAAGVWTGWSFLNADYSPTPTYVAYSTTAKSLDDCDVSGPTFNNVPSLPSDAGTPYQVAQFENSSNLFSETCLWSSDPAGATVKWRIPFSASLTGIDAMGRTITVPGGGEITVGATPVYLRAYRFFAPTVTGTITVAHNTTIPGLTFADYMMPSTFAIQGATPSFTAKTPVTPGTYRVLVKIGTVWEWYTIVAT